jgi:hypothetical protein
MSQENVQVVRIALEALQRGDIATFLQALDQEVEIHEPDSLPYGGTYKGHEGIQRLIGALAETWMNLEALPEEILGAGDTVLVMLRLKAQGRKSGKEIDMPVAEFWDMRNRKAIRIRLFYQDTVSILQILQESQNSRAS